MYINELIFKNSLTLNQILNLINDLDKYIESFIYIYMYDHIQ